MSPCAATKAQPRPRFSSLSCSTAPITPQDPSEKSTPIPLRKTTRGRQQVRAGDSLVCPLESSERKERLPFLHALHAPYSKQQTWQGTNSCSFEGARVEIKQRHL